MIISLPLTVRDPTTTTPQQPARSDSHRHETHHYNKGRGGGSGPLGLPTATVTEASYLIHFRSS